MGRRAEQSIDKEEIVEVACEVFSEKGYAGTNLDDIAVRLNITRTPIYYYFKNKQNLFYEVAKRYYNEVVALSREVFTKEISIFDMFHEELMSVTALERPRYMNLMADVRRQSPSSQALFPAGADPLEELYHYKLRIVERAKESGDLRKDVDGKEFLAMWYYFFYGVISNMAGYLYDDDKSVLMSHGNAYIEMMRSRYQNPK